MVRLFMCAAGNCQEEMEPKQMVLVREPNGEQQRFCSNRHAAEWLARRALMFSYKPVLPSDHDAQDVMRRLADT